MCASNTSASLGEHPKDKTHEKHTYRKTRRASDTTSRAILQTVLATDGSLSAGERGTVQRLIDGETEVPAAVGGGIDKRLLVTQKSAAELLSVSRVTIWRIPKDCALHPVEILPGTWRYPYREIAALACRGVGVETSANADRHQMSAA